MGDANEIAVREWLVDYEVRGAWRPHYISHPVLQELTARYFVWKVRRKLDRQAKSRAMSLRVADLRRAQDGEGD